MPITPLRLNGRDAALRKTIISPTFGARTVLTNSPWTFVSLWLKRNKKNDAQYYWEQAQHFHRASIGLPLESSPLLLYYSYMNAAKALLSAKGIAFSPYHGVKVRNLRGPNGKISLSNEGLRIQANGIVPSLATYFQETEAARDYTMKELLFNSTFVHRTYCLTYRSQREMFVPLRKSGYVFDSNRNVVFFEGYLATDVVRPKLVTSLPPSLVWVDLRNKHLRSAEEIPWRNPSTGNNAELAALNALHSKLRFDLTYINGSQPLWYVKLETNGPKRIVRRGPTITLCAMHRMSEICRYRPNELSSYIDGQQNWLLSEFIAMSPEQYLDEVACEITRQQFMIPNVRAPI